MLVETPLRLHREVVVPAVEAYAFVEAQLCRHSLLLVPVSSAKEPTLAVYGPDELADVTPLAVSSDNLSSLTDHTSLWVEMLLGLNDASADALASKLWVFARDTRKQAVLATSENTITLRGSGAWVGGMASMMITADGEAWTASHGTPGSAEHEFVVPTGEDYTLADLLDDYARRTDQHLVASSQTLRELSETEAGLQRQAIVPPDEVAAFVEGILSVYGISLSVLKGGEEPVLGVQSAYDRRRSTDHFPLPISAERIDAFRDRPAISVRTILALPNLDSRTLQTQLRALVTDTSTEKIVSLDRNRMVVEGLGHRAAEIAEIMQAIDSASGSDAGPTAFFQSEELPQANAPLALAGRSSTLGQLVDELGELTSQHVIASHATRDRLEEHWVDHEHAPVPASDVYAYVEAVLVDQGFVIAPIKYGGAPQLGVYGIRDRHGSRLKSVADAHSIRPGDQEGARRHPGLFARAVVHMPNTDTRMLQTQLRALVTDTSTQAMISAGRHSLIMYGTASQLGNWVELLQRVDRLGRKEPVTVTRPSDSQPSALTPLLLPNTETNLAEVLGAYARSTGQYLIKSRQVGTELLETRIELTEPLEVPTGEIHAFVHALLSENGFAVEPIPAEQPLLQIYSIKDRQTTRNQRPMFVEASDAARFADQPAMPVLTLVSLAHVDARTLQIQLRGNVTDTSRMHMLAVGQGLLLSGFAPWVSSMVELVGAIDRKSGSAFKSRGPTLAPARFSMKLSESEEMLSSLVTALGEATNQRISLTEETREALELVRLEVSPDREVPREKTYSIVESILVDHGYGISPIKGGTLPILGVYRLDSIKRESKPLSVDPKEIAAVASDHPALYVQTVVTVEKLDPRVIQKQLRHEITDISLQTLAAVGDKRVLIKGLAPWVGEMTRQIRASDQ